MQYENLKTDTFFAILAVKDLFMESFIFFSIALKTFL